MVSIAYKEGDSEETGYFYARNAQGAIIAIYRSSDSALIGSYEYDLWGRPVSIKEATEGIDTDGILHKNPFRYRGYYYDNESGFYYLNARYYDPEVRRFISSDSLSLLMVATGVGDTLKGIRAAAKASDAAKAVRKSSEGTENLYKLYRKTSNTGGYKNLQEAMQLKNVKNVANKAGIGLDGISVKIDRNPELLGKGIYGYIDGKILHYIRTHLQILKLW